MSKQSPIKAFLDFWRVYLIITKKINFCVIFKTFQNLGCYSGFIIIDHKEAS